VNRVHVWSDIPNDSSGSTSGDANEHAEEQGDIVINVNSIAELLALFIHTEVLALFVLGQTN
jgi:hypothetical protein